MVDQQQNKNTLQWRKQHQLIKILTTQLQINKLATAREASKVLLVPIHGTDPD